MSGSLQCQLFLRRLKKTYATMANVHPVRLGQLTVKTKLLKLPFPGDAAHFSRHTVSITGWSYTRLPYGPVIGRESGASADPLFSAPETETISYVDARVGRMNVVQLFSHTHTLPAWNQTPHAGATSFEPMRSDAGESMEGE